MALAGAKEALKRTRIGKIALGVAGAGLAAKAYLDKKKKEAFQLLCYCLMYSNTLKKAKNLNAGIISFKNLSLGLISLKKSKTESYNVEELNDFKKVLDNIIEEIFDQSISFSENQP